MWLLRREVWSHLGSNPGDGELEGLGTLVTREAYRRLDDHAVRGNNSKLAFGHNVARIPEASA